jgi:hypothetical protein
MKRIMFIGVFCLLSMGAPGVAADSLAGNWALTRPGEESILWLIRIENKDGGYGASVLDAAQQIGATELAEFTGSANRIEFALRLRGNRFPVEAVPAGPDTMLGSVRLGRALSPIRLERTSISSLKDSYEMAKDAVARHPDDPASFEAAKTLFARASAKGASAAEVRSWADKLFRSSERYGPRMHQEVGLQIAEALAAQKDFAAIAVEYARRTERSMESTEPASAQVRVLNALASALRATGKDAEAKALDGRIEKLEQQADAEYLRAFPPLKVEPFSGSKKDNRTVLVELFTGAQCPPCVAADIAFDGATRVYKPQDVVLLQYHLHIPGPDPLTNSDSEARQAYYADAIEGTPTMLFNGKPEAGGGGPPNAAPEKLKEYEQVINALLDRAPPDMKLDATAVRKGDDISISAKVSNVAEPSDKLRLRFALVEEQVRYVGGNNIRFHHHLVRAMPGGAAGFAITNKETSETVSVSVSALRKRLEQYLHDAAQRMPFSGPQRPPSLKNLTAVAYVQNDTSREILQAVQVKIQGEAAD